MNNYATIALIFALLTVAAFTITWGLRAVAFTIETNLSGYVEDSQINKAILKAVAFFLVTFIILVVSVKLALGDSVVVQGRLFQETCNDKDPVRHAACVGFVAGVANSYLNSGQTCIQANTDPKEVTDFVRYYLNTNVALLNQPAVNVVLLALKARYPCVSQFQQFPRVQFQFRGF